MFSFKNYVLFCGRKQEPRKIVGLVGDSGIGKTIALRKIRGLSLVSSPTKGHEEIDFDSILILDISGDIESIANPKSLVSRCDILFGVSGSSPKLLNYWRELCKDSKCFFEMIILENLEQRLEKI
uniref:P-loop kinase n=1 Tax=Marseillevirus sp. TaxID=2809551 RepID=A0AA96IXG6_9VIRU|nr:P-loop kinase [Marseillevirus sp.]